MNRDLANRSAPLIHLLDCSRTYGDVHAVRNAEVSIDSGEFVAIAGASGSGKSTLLGLLGLLETPSSGEYHFRGQPVSTLEDSELSRLRNRTFGFVFQQFHLLPELTAWENVARPLQYARVAGKERKARALALLREFGLEHRSHHRPAQLSGGEQQRVAIARALVNDPDVILADEPTGSLPQSQWQPVLEALRKLNQRGKTVIMVTHEPQIAAEAERRILLRDGQIVEG